MSAVLLSPASRYGVGGSATLDIALVNNMPDSALIQTERQFAALLEAGSGDRQVRLRRYTLPGIARGPQNAEHISRHYFPMHELFEQRPAAVIITGCEPHAADLDAEPYWYELAGVLDWARREVASVVASCLAAHAALLLFDGVQRKSLTHKRSGVFEQDVQSNHPLTAGIPPRVAVPHSRQNDVPTAALEESGYTALIASTEIGWTVGCKELGGHLLVVMQGHPEYEKDSLLLEFRRDVRRYLHGKRPSYPDVPVGYFDGSAAPILNDLGSGVLDDFPTDTLAAHTRQSWLTFARRLYANWLVEVARREDARCATRL